MKLPACIAAIPLAAFMLAAGASAQTTVYETRDAEGNVTFSDEASSDSRAIDIQKTSVADAPEPLPRESVQEREAAGAGDRARQEPAGRAADTEYEGGDDYLYDDYDDPRLRRDAARERLESATPGERPVARDGERAADGSLGEGGGEAVGRADEAAERSDITGPNAEYRNTQHPERHAGGRR